MNRRLLRAAGETHAVGLLERFPVVAGGLCGNLRVVEEVVGRRIGGSRAWRCVCVNPRDGAACGAVVVKGTHYLTKPSFRACPRCADEHQKESRKTYGRNVVRRVRD